MDDFSGSVLHLSTFLIKDSRSASILDGVLSGFWYWLNCHILVFSEDITTPRKSLFLCDSCLLLLTQEDNSNNKKTASCFDVIYFNNADNFFTGI